MRLVVLSDLNPVRFPGAASIAFGLAQEARKNMMLNFGVLIQRVDNPQIHMKSRRESEKFQIIEFEKWTVIYFNDSILKSLVLESAIGCIGRLKNSNRLTFGYIKSVPDSLNLLFLFLRLLKSML